MFHMKMMLLNARFDIMVVTTVGIVAASICAREKTGVLSFHSLTR